MPSLRCLYVFCVLTIFGPILLGQSTSPTKKTVPPTLSKPIEWPTTTYRMFADESRKLSVDFSTSWIPGEKHAGMFRYKMRVYYDNHEEVAARLEAGDVSVSGRDASVEKLLNRVRRCTIMLELYDADGFVLREHVVQLAGGVDAQTGLIGSLTANEAFQMDAEEYSTLVKNGRYDIAWACQ